MPTYRIELIETRTIIEFIEAPTETEAAEVAESFTGDLDNAENFVEINVSEETL